MTVNLQLLKTTLGTDHPVSGAWNADPKLAAAQGNTIDRDGLANSGLLLQYAFLEKYRTNTGTDLTALHLFGRLQMATDAAVGADVFGSGTGSLSLEQKTSCITFIEILTSLQSGGGGITMDLLDSRWAGLLNDVKNAEVMGAGDKTAIQALSQNKQSYFQEVGIGFVRAGDVIKALALS